ncbi:hypothetical protein WR25_10870 isoform C [Diploscapter pachys]|uniref:SUZ domain-containing protein n=1 Tax=Diploscapter pachys TaxID=2018661 RepID=A0A2A2LZ78_9BILA|nr:hypothetical protein WR25_10870 isoform A [Diploscapter pachys]PAV91552.1 hypothetical protein WR25_10870 isoform C [Diploscapter pachys]
MKSHRFWQSLFILCTSFQLSNAYSYPLPTRALRRRQKTATTIATTTTTIQPPLEIFLSSPSTDRKNSKLPLLLPISYDLQLQLPLSEVTDPETPLFIGRVVFQFDITSQIGPPSVHLNEKADNRASFRLEIANLDNFENVSLVLNNEEIEIVNVILTDYDMEVFVDQPVLFPGRYTLGVHRYKGFVGSAIYYRDAGEHAVFGSALFPHRAQAVFPVTRPITAKATFSLSIVHPHGTTAVTTSPPTSEKATKVDENWQVENTYTGIPLTVHYNRYRIQQAQARHLLSTATQVMTILKQIFSSAIPVPKIDLILLNDAISLPSIGAIIISETPYLSSDYANQIWLLANLLGRQWISGLVAISNEEHICLQEDIVAYLAFKIVKRMTNDASIRLSHYIKIILTETLFFPETSLSLDENYSDIEISNHCGLKGVTMLESLEFLLSEQDVLERINKLAFSSKNGYFDPSFFYKLLSATVDKHVNVGQVGSFARFLFKFLFHVLSFGRAHGGIPYLFCDRIDANIELKQVSGNRTVKKGVSSWERMPVWPLPLDFNQFKLPVKLMLSEGVHLAPVREGLVLANLGFSHFYRVNYDVDTWQRVREALLQNATHFTERERIQLISDFCFFYAKGYLAEPEATKLRTQFIELIKLRPESFPACESSLFMCTVGFGKAPRPLEKRKMAQLRSTWQTSAFNLFLVMSQNVAQTLSSASNYVTDDWENGEEVEKQVQERLKQVRILQREKEDKEALIAKVRAEDSHKAEMAAATGLSSSNDTPSSSSSTANPLPMKMQILRRPKPYSDQSIDCQGRETKPVEHTDETAAQHEMNEEVRKARTLEARQAAYDEARLRILGTDYKPDETPTPQITVVDRSKSPEQIRIPNYSKNGHSMNKQQPQPHLVGTNPNPNAWSRSASSPNTFMQTGAMPPHYALPNVANHAVGIFSIFNFRHFAIF